MSRCYRRLFAVAVWLAAIGVAGAAEPPGQRWPEPRRGAASELDREVSGVRERTGGRVLSTRTYQEESGEVEVIRILTPDGRVRRFQFDHAAPRRSLVPR